MARLIGLLGGTFDPVHCGHLQPARAVGQRLPLDELRLVPCRRPSHREPPVAGSQERLAMLRLALESFSDLTLETAELERSGPSYAVDTLHELHAREPDAIWCWLLGVDAFRTFTRWRRWRRILELAHLVVMTRPGYVLDGQAERLAQQHGIPDERYAALREQTGGGIMLLDVDSPDISATQIRRRLRERQPLTGLVPPAVADYLENNPIYSQRSLSS